MRPKKPESKRVKTKIVSLYKEDAVIIEELEQVYGIGFSGLVRMLLREKHSIVTKSK